MWNCNKSVLYILAVMAMVSARKCICTYSAADERQGTYVPLFILVHQSLESYSTCTLLYVSFRDGTASTKFCRLRRIIRSILLLHTAEFDRQGRVVTVGAPAQT